MHNRCIYRNRLSHQRTLFNVVIPSITDHVTAPVQHSNSIPYAVASPSVFLDFQGSRISGFLECAGGVHFWIFPGQSKVQELGYVQFTKSVQNALLPQLNGLVVSAGYYAILNDPHTHDLALVSSERRQYLPVAG